MEMIKNRNLTSHTYNEQISEEIFKNVVSDFYPLFVAFEETMETIKAKNN